MNGKNCCIPGGSEFIIGFWKPLFWLWFELGIGVGVFEFKFKLIDPFGGFDWLRLEGIFESLFELGLLLLLFPKVGSPGETKGIVNGYISRGNPGGG